jgi:succinate dehydrogenase / fumarate reductase flavoprotein subunit
MIDVLVVGSGGAGLSAALRAKELGKRVVVVSKSYPTQAQTSMAQGGINAAASKEDIEAHIADTLRSGAGLSDEEVVEYVCRQAPKAIEWLDSLGVPFSRKGSAIARRKLGGASAPRACYAQDYTGLKILHTLYDQALKAGIEFLNEKFLLNVIVEDGVAKGVTLLDIKTSQVEQYLARTVVLATGGFAKLYGSFSTNAAGMVGEGLAAAMRAGAKLSDLEFVQFHPTGLEKSSILISEAARGAGAKIVNEDGERFVDELTTRDRLARAIWEQIEAGKRVFLDMRHLGEEFIQKELPQERKLALIYEGVDPAKDLLPIKPVAHYTMGGIDVDENMRTSVKNLFAAGECANAKLHGANRLGGNSLLEIVVLGRKAGEMAAQVEEDVDKREYERTKIDKNFIVAAFNLPNKIDFYDRREFLSKVMYQNAGVVREELALKGVLAVIRQHQRELSFMGIKDKSPLYNTNLLHFLEYGNAIELAEAAVVAMTQRNESRGAHFRKDYPKKDDENFRAHSVVWKEDGVLCAEFKEIER